MSEPTSSSSFPSALDWDRQPQTAVWVTPRPRPRWWLHILLLAATFLSTLVVGARIYANFAARQPAFSFNDDSISFFPVEWMWQAPARLMHGLSFSLTLMFILLAHEMGHYLYARHYRVYATPPFFIPFPSLIGTLGAFIRIKGPIPNRTALFDIGIAGPIAGFIPSCAAVLMGLSLSHPQVFSHAPLDNEPGFPLAFHLAARLLHLNVPLTSLSLHPHRGRRMGGNVRDRDQPVARRPTRRRTHFVFGASETAPLGFAGPCIRAHPAGQVLLDSDG